MHASSDRSGSYSHKLKLRRNKREMGGMISVSEVGDRFQLPRVVEAKSPPDRERIPSSSLISNA
jgi:hypothetical protein